MVSDKHAALAKLNLRESGREHTDKLCKLDIKQEGLAKGL